MKLTRQVVYRLARWVFWGLAAYFILFFFLDNSSEILRTVREISPIQYFCSISIAIIGTLAAAMVWSITVSYYGVKRSVIDHARAWSISRISRYIPGKVLPLVLRFSQYEKGEASDVGAAFILESFTVLVMAGMAILLATVTGLIVIPQLAGWGILVLVISLLFALSSRNINERIDSILRRVRLPLSLVSHQWRRILFSSLAQAAIMAIHGLSLSVLIAPIDQISIVDWFRNTAIYYLAGLAGMASVFTPGGLGVREGVLAFFLSFHVPLSQAVIVSLAIRITSIVADVVTCAAFWSAQRFISARNRCRSNTNE